MEPKRCCSGFITTVNMIWRKIKNTCLRVVKRSREVCITVVFDPMRRLYHRTVYGLKSVKSYLSPRRPFTTKLFHSRFYKQRPKLVLHARYLTEDESDDNGTYEEVSGVATETKTCTVVTRCCICLKKIRSSKTALILPCFHNSQVHTSCVWDWVRCHPRTNKDSGEYHITCPMCRSSKTTRLVSYRDAYGPICPRPVLR